MLVSGLEHDEKEAVVRRFEAMESEFKYLIEVKKQDFSDVRELGWTEKKLRVVFCLNSFYQRILAPLWASPMSPTVIGSEVPIRYGKSIVFNTDRNASVTKMGISFLEICGNYRIKLYMLEAQRTSDLIWKINNPH